MSEAGRYGVRHDAEYLVAGMYSWENVLHYVVVNRDGGPHFVPAALFERATVALPSTWLFSLMDGAHAHDWLGDSRIAIWGYPELVNDPGHLGALAEGDHAARDIFNKRCAEMGIDH